MHVLKFFARRFFHSIFVFLAVVTILFFLFRMMPGDPTLLFLSPEMGPEAMENTRKAFGLDKPLFNQYLLYIGNLCKGDFGMSFFYGEPVVDIVFEALQNTLVLTVTAICLSYLIGLVGGTLLAWKRGTNFEFGGMILMLILRSAPVFWVGLIALYFLAFKLHLFPGGSMTETGTIYGGFLELVFSWTFLHHLALPLVSFTAYLLGLPVLLTRTSILEAIKEDYVEMARAKGIGQRRVMFRHVTRNAILPVVTSMVTHIATAFGGSVLIETVFSWPGIGRLMVQSILGTDYPVTQFAFMIVASMLILANLIADFLYGYLDPRVVVQ
jgi:peptide/nickel transport system permease protein